MATASFVFHRLLVASRYLSLGKSPCQKAVLALLPMEHGIWKNGPVDDEDPIVQVGMQVDRGHQRQTLTMNALALEQEPHKVLRQAGNFSKCNVRKTTWHFVARG